MDESKQGGNQGILIWPEKMVEGREDKKWSEKLISPRTTANGVAMENRWKRRGVREEMEMVVNKR
ncbi:hypothetical protein E2C01_074046 [Portunus trituberculatus]|uniref:Uncharacterized protein n=1 Tax=Portunus trituberculatus TaxID=210409 RepID=A0A5B7IDA5_PORTR|nr:hypothetical protein [Portunus trituberculatus]